MSNAALRSNSRAIATHEWTSRHPQVFKCLFPEHAVGHNRQKCHAQLLVHHEWDDNQAKNGIRTNDTGSRAEELDCGSPEDCAADRGLPVRRVDICGKD
jgi:hypothetical protein